MQRNGHASHTAKDAQGNPYGRNHPRFIQHRPAELAPGGAHGAQQSELPGPFRNRDGKGAVNQGHRSQHNEKNQNGSQIHKDPAKVIIPEHPVRSQQAPVLILRQIVVPDDAVQFIYIRCFVIQQIILRAVLLRHCKKGIPRPGIGLEIRPLIKAHHCVAPSLSDLDGLPIAQRVILV